MSFWQMLVDGRGGILVTAFLLFVSAMCLAGMGVEK